PMPALDSIDRLLLRAGLSGRGSPEQIVEALLEWKSGASLERALLQRGLIDPGLAQKIRDTGPSQGDATLVQPQAAAHLGGGRNEAVRYSKRAFHAKGGLGEVFRAQDHELDREVALKQIQEHSADDAGARSRFVREAQLTGRLEHPGIVPVYGLG